MSQVKCISRRRWLTGVAKTSLLLGATLPAVGYVPRVLGAEDTENPPEQEFTPSVYLEIGRDNRVRVICHRSEMGQGIRTSLAMVVADELNADWSQVELVQALGGKRYGSQNTDGSNSIRGFYTALREAGATARHMLEHAAAQRWQLEPDLCRAANGAVKAGERSLSFGELAELAATQKVPDKSQLTLKTKKEFNFIGNHEIGNLDAVDMLTGRAVYGIDVEQADLAIAVVVRPPTMGAKPVKYDAKDALKVPGVIQVIEMPELSYPVRFQPLGGVAVVAENTWAAMKGSRQLNVQWAASEHDSFDSQQYAEKLEGYLTKEMLTHREKGDVKTTLEQAEATFTRRYYVPSLAHAPMEPPAASAVWHHGIVEIWAATQNPQAAQKAVADQFAIDETQVKVNVTLLGGGFGRKSKQDFVVEAAYLSKSLKRPVKVVWTREDDLQFDYYHACSRQEISCALEGKNITAWRHREAGPGIQSIFKSGFSGIQFESNMGMRDMPFAVDNVLCTSGPGEAHVRYGWLRSVANIGHAFAIGSYVDELAHELKQDPFQYWLDLLGSDRYIDFSQQGTKYFNYGENSKDYPFDVARIKNTLRRAADIAGWGEPLPAGQGMGISVHRSFCSNVACVALAETSGERVRIKKIWMVIDAGMLVNPDRVRAQLEGAAIFGVSLAYYGEITHKNGVAQQQNFDGYRLLRMNETPEIITDIIDVGDPLPGGVGEPGVPPVAPAVCNAIFAVTGKRCRELPLHKQGLV
ncbi:molybdopterin-dependent oxidoreductase [Gilvimarinus agarilyticus]|uniref:xanthine dehydrogenase family protein molybdopterin-binding subunit n=1 Tax=Gilvimarinus sp. 2_MG-2023 TaxID=3062666 RepID=UPI001C0A63CB|nr:molybdopterin cofactor-binding domain-containing protein [Gilvimarinus sp. 2_MG-2023]MBU2886362.1 molybdopterin-dependent oxidoreductase [Gilvimarinus agarilyticus]MDO6571041.1 molybdopterin-dependent oxidoreductase [Gilvimarinus sp. 2_MG-2023]